LAIVAIGCKPYLPSTHPYAFETSPSGIVADAAGADVGVGCWRLLVLAVLFSRHRGNNISR